MPSQKETAGTGIRAVRVAHARNHNKSTLMVNLLTSNSPVVADWIIQRGGLRNV